MLKKKFLYLLLNLIFIASCGFTNRTTLSEKEQILVDVILYVLEQGHYSPKPIDDTLSEQIFNGYIKTLDPFKKFFLDSDIEKLSEHKFIIDDAIKGQNLDFFSDSYTIFKKRVEESKEICEQILAQPIPLHQKKKIKTDYDEIKYPKGLKGLKERWTDQITLAMLSDYSDKINEKYDSIQSMSEVELEKIVRANFSKNIDNLFEYYKELERHDYFVFYLNTIVEIFDPHTYYFDPRTKEKFDTSISGKFEGIGAQLQKKDNKVKVTKIISGGPVWKTNALEVGDCILEVAQDDGKPGVKIGNMRLDNAIEYIKGPKGTKVKLKVLRVDGTIDNTVTIVRDVVEIEETYLKSATVNYKDKNYAIVNLPKFYFDFDDSNNRTAASDMKKEIERFRQKNIDGIIIDLRNNGGGALQTVIDIGGFFIPKGPIVQVKNANDKIEVLDDKDISVEWEKPLVILINTQSASASEILAAAMQDYKRAVILGSEHTYGKGTVQNIIDLNKLIRDSDIGDPGSIKITTQKFYRINGGSTQLKGVKSDVIIPDKYSYISVGERETETPLPWDKIEAAVYTAYNQNENLITKLVKKSKQRLNNNKVFKLIDQNAKWIKKQQNVNEISLNLKTYLAQVEDNKKFVKKFDTLIGNNNSNLTFKSLPYEINLIEKEKDTLLKEKRRRWHKNLSKDPYVEEALEVLIDWDSYSNNKVTAISTDK